MRKKIHKNLVGIAALAIILTIGLTFWAYFMMLQKQIFQDLQTDVHVLASSDYIVDTLEQNYDANADGLRITLISKDGSVLYESKGNASKMENHMERPEVQQALKNGEGKATRRSNTIGTLSFYYAEKLDNGCIIRVSRDIPYVAKLSVYLIPEGIAIFAGIFVLCLILGHIMTKRFIEPIEMLAVDVEKVSEMQTYPEIQPFIETINQQHRELKRNSKMRQEFTANVSHELKTPITSMKVLADSLVGQENVPEELYQEFLTDIAKEIDRENDIITDLLNLVRMDSGNDKINISTVNINELVESTLKRLRPIAEVKNIEVVLESFRPVMADVDEVKFNMVVTNLVENAIKYNVTDGWVRVSLNADHQYFYLKVADSGIGIEDDQQEHIFERFFRVDKARARETGGTGLGLSITKNIILLHKGTVKVHSKEGEGTTFTVRIPLKYIEQ